MIKKFFYKSIKAKRLILKRYSRLLLLIIKTEKLELPNIFYK